MYLIGHIICLYPNIYPIYDHTECINTIFHTWMLWVPQSLPPACTLALRGREPAVCGRARAPELGRAMRAAVTGVERVG